MQKLNKTLKSIAAIGTGVVFLGASVTGALALDLKDYPAPFVTDGKYDSSNVLVVGAIAAASDTLGMVDIATNLQFESKDCTAVSGGTITVSGGDTEDIPLGSPIAGSSNTFDQQLEDNDIDSLLDSTVNFKSANYDFHEVVLLGHMDKDVTIATSLTSSEDDYETDIVMEVEKDAIKYYYAFDESIEINEATTSDSLNIRFLGKTLKIIDVGADDKFTAYVGTEYFMDVDDSVDVDGKLVTLKNVGSKGAVIVEVDGVIETIQASGTETVNGIEVSVDETFYDNDKAQKSATLIVGEDSRDTYKDGDAYIGEDEDDPEWIWDINNLNTNSATTINDNSVHVGPVIGIENDFVWNDKDDNPTAIGECINLPNDYISICLQSLTVADDEYVTYTFEYDNSADLSDADESLTSAAALYIHTSLDEGLVVKHDVAGVTDVKGSDAKTDKVWFSGNSTGTDMSIYYEDTSGDTQIFGYFDDNISDILEINYDSTKGKDISMDVGMSYLDNQFDLTLKPHDSSDLDDGSDNIRMAWKINNGEFSSLGSTESSDEADELKWDVKTIGTKDEDHRTKYGIIINDPKSSGSGDEVVLEIPGDIVQANVVVKGTSSTTSSTGETCTIADVTPVTKLDSEIAGSESSYNLILVGGPCANKAVEAVADLGLTCAGWELKAGEGMVRLADNGDKIAMLVAGTNAIDTRRSAKVIANYNDYELSGTEAMVKGTTLTDITVE